MSDSLELVPGLSDSLELVPGLSDSLELVPGRGCRLSRTRPGTVRLVGAARLSRTRHVRVDEYPGGVFELTSIPAVWGGVCFVRGDVLCPEFEGLGRSAQSMRAWDVLCPEFEGLGRSVPRA